ncbi:universal stress protein [Hydrocarboniphaga sp.]|uniref:universal stress protein n=1 Tax=Hydrocarboniphaga sp. TaxID=2033016 RepID=UPI003D0B41C9
MSQYQRILLIADSAMRRTAAFEQAAWLARRSGAELHMAIFDRNAIIAAAGEINSRGYADAESAWLQQRRRWLSDQAAELAGLGIRTRFEVIWAKAAAKPILDHVAEVAPDIVIKDGRYESHLRRLLFTPLDWQLLRLCPVPLMFASELSHVVPKRIVAAVDASYRTVEHDELNHRIIKQALSLSIQCDAELHLVYSMAGPNSMIDADGSRVGAIGELYASLLPTHQRNFEALAKLHSVPEDRRHFLDGQPAKTLPRFVRADHSDVLVLGSTRHSMLDRFLMGTNAEAILDAAPCSILAVKS